MRRERIVFVGLGKMGAPMARHLHSAGHELQGIEPDRTRRDALGGMGLPLLPSLHAANLADPPALVISSLPDDAALLSVARELTLQPAPGAAWVDTSTVSPAASRQAAALCETRGLPYLRAPVSGNAPMAEAARLTVLASGDRTTYTRCESLFACWGEHRFYLGEADEARTCKLALNLMVIATSAMLAEALVLGQRAGVAREDLWRVIEASAVASPLLRAKAPALRAHDYTATFSVAQMRKDIALMTDVSRELGIELLLAEHCGRALARAEAAGAGALDYAVIVREAERHAGLLPSQPTPTPP
jgi:3-hydroxyisobutyrate dehydrogenase-like beta-hydroxyacid dehydrogenase